MKSLLLFISLIAVSQLFAQTGVFTGTVKDAETNLSLPGATILIDDVSTGTGTTSNAEGTFRLTNLSVGSHTVSVSYIGYEEYEASITIQEGQTTVLIISLKPGVVMGDEVVVLGESLKGQARALNQQKNNNNVTNIVAADQIGRFPDANIGDAMKRIPGITIQNDQGEARFGLVRGTAARLNSVMINGERIPSAEAENREVQLDLIPADMVQAIEVNKTITPDMDADAIGGAINMVTRSAPNDFRLSATLGSGLNTLRNKPMGIGSFIIADRVANDKLGIVLSGSYFAHQLGSHNFEAEWDLDDNNNPFVNEFEVRNYVVDRTRRSVSLGMDYRFSANHSVYVKGMYNHRDDWENRYRVRIRRIEVDADGNWEARRVVHQTKGGIDSDRVRNARLEDQRTRYLAIGGDHTFGNIQMTWSANYAKASEERPNERYIAYETGRTALNYDISNPRFPSITFATPLTNNDFEFDEITEQNQLTFDEDLNGRFDLIIPGMSGRFANTFKVGFRYRSKTKSRENNFFEYGPLSGDFDSFATLPSDAVSNVTPENYLAGDYEVGDFVTKEYLGGLDLKDGNQFEESDAPAEYVPANFEATEAIAGGYLMVTQQLGDKLSAIAGVRLENTNINYTGNEFILDGDGDPILDQIVPVSSADAYTNILPGIHLNYRPNNRSVVRLAWTNTLARPNYYNLVPFRNINLEDNELFEGNSTLVPTTSMNLDLMAEYYTNNVGLLSGGIFYKNIDNFIYTQQLNDYVDPVTGTTFDNYFQPRNGGTASLFGFELAVQRQLDFLPGMLKNFNVYFNYTFTNSTAEGIRNEDGELREDIALPGTAEHMLNASLSFETKKFNARLALNYASDYIDELGGDAFFDRYYDQQLFVDANASYQITKSLRVFAEANNLTNQPLRYFQGTADQTMQAEYYGPRFQGGLKLDLQ